MFVFCFFNAILCKMNGILMCKKEKKSSPTHLDSNNLPWSFKSAAQSSDWQFLSKTVCEKQRKEWLQHEKSKIKLQRRNMLGWNKKHQKSVIQEYMVWVLMKFKGRQISSLSELFLSSSNWTRSFHQNQTLSELFLNPFPLLIWQELLLTQCFLHSYFSSQCMCMKM